MQQNISELVATEFAAPTNPIMLRAEVQKMAGVSRVTLWRWIKEGRFPAPIPHWPGKEKAWRRADILTFISGNVATAQVVH